MKACVFLLLLVLTTVSAFAQQIKFESMPSGQMKAVGSDFNRSATGNKQVNFYKNGQFIKDIQMNSNGSFSYTSPASTFQSGDSLTVKVLQYRSSSSHFEKTAKYNYVVSNHTLDFTNLPDGQIRVVGKNFNKSESNDQQVNFYKNGQFIDHIFRNDNGSFSYTAPAHTFSQGDRMTVKVLNYLGNGDHFTKSFEYRYENDDYISGCYKNLTLPANVELCLRLKVPASISQGCGAHTTTYENEALCLRNRVNPEIAQSCKKYVSKYAPNETLCLQLQVPAHISQACGLYTRTYGNEALCMRVRTEPETAKACRKYMGTDSNETACIQTRNLSPRKIESCGLHTTTYESELYCIQTAARN